MWFLNTLFPVRKPPRCRVRLPRRHAPACPPKSKPGRRWTARRSPEGGRSSSLPCSSLIAASGRRSRRRGSQRDRSLTVSSGPEAFPEGTLEIALVCTGRERTVVRLSLAAISRAARMDDSLTPQKARRVVPRGNAAGPGRLQSGNKLLRIDSQATGACSVQRATSDSSDASPLAPRGTARAESSGNPKTRLHRPATRRRPS